MRCSFGPRGGIQRLVVAAVIAACPFTTTASAQGPTASDVELKAAVLFNFAKFAEWPTLAPDALLIICIAGDKAIADVLTGMVRGKQINAHALEIWQPRDATLWRPCHVLFIGAAETERSAGGLGAIKTLPVLTVSDHKGFSLTGGIIELYIEDARIRFAINVDATERSGLRLSSRLLAVAKVVRDRSVQ